MELQSASDFDQILTLAKSLPLEEEKKLVEEINNDIKVKSTGQRRPGDLKGLIIYMADDFDEPLEDFKDYM